MSSQHIFWFIAGAMTGAAAYALSLRALGRAAPGHGNTRPLLLVCGAVLLTAIAALGLYRMWGTPAVMTLNPAETALISDMQHPRVGASTAASAGAGKSKVGSVEDATAGLAKRLNEQGGTAADWTLLAQSYEFMGRTADAAAARKRAGNSPTGATPAPSATPPTVSAEGSALLAQAEKARIAHDYPRALGLYAQAAKLNALSADAWANYADAAASVSASKLAGAPAQYLQHALQLEPDHPKALWLQASLFHQQQQYAKAIEVWRHLASVMPADSSDAKIIAANIAEATQLAGITGSVSKPPAPPPPGAVAQIEGTIDIEPALRARATAGQTLFVFAKAVGAPGPPLAVVRTTVGQWPVKFLLNDSQAMVPQRKLSDFRAVTVEARISSSGQPLAQAGDLHGVTATLDPTDRKPVRVVIGKVVGS